MPPELWLSPGLAFDVPAEAKGLVLSYQAIVILGGYQTIRVQLD